MPNTKSAKKELRKSSKRAIQNKEEKVTMKKTIKTNRKAVVAKDKDLSNKLLKESIKTIDKAAKKGIIKKNTASRYKSRLQKQVNKLK